MKDIPADRNLIWQDTKESLYVEKGFETKITPPADVAEVILAYNNMANLLEKRLALTFIVDRYDYSFLKLFNYSPGAVLFWERSLTKHQYTKAKVI